MPLASPPHAGGSAPPRPTAQPSKHQRRPGRPALPQHENPPWWPAELSAWHVWRGVNGLWYAWHPRTSPPVVHRTRRPGALIVRAAGSEEGWTR